MKKIILVSIILAILLLSGFLLTKTSLEWDEDLENLERQVTVSDIQALKIGVKVGDLFFKEDELEIYLNEKPVRPGLELSNQLNGFGTYKLEAKYKNHSILKKFMLLKDNKGSAPIDHLASLLLEHSDIYYEELDTDGDGIIDCEELDIYETDPYHVDTDCDDYFDNQELILGLDPLEKDDFRERREYVVKGDSYNLEVSGYGNIANVFVDEIHVEELERNGFVIGDTLEITSSVQFRSPINGASTIDYALVEFKLDAIDTPDDVGIFVYDRKTGNVSWLESRINKKKNTISATVQNLQILGLGYKTKKPDQIKTEIALVIDNSGSMFSKEYVEGVTGNTTSNNSTDYGRDTEFNRLSLMQSLIEKLEGDKYRFSVGAFQSSYHQVTGITDSKDAVTKSIERIKTEFQTFDGTSIETALDEGLREYSQNSFNKKYMILLTDGYSTLSLYSFPPSLESILNEAKKLKVEIITIGLGDCDEALLKQIASETDSIFIDVKDSDALIKLTDRLLSSMKELELDRNGDGVADAQMIADSGFKTEVDGFPFSNFGDENSPGGNCYGIALTTKLIYEGALLAELKETKLRGIVAGTMENNILKAYKMDESSMELIKNSNTFDIHVPTLFMIESPPSWDELRNPNGDTGVIDPKFKQKLIDTGHALKVVDNKCKVDGKDVKKIETASLDAWSQKANENVPSTELDFIKIINRNHNAQMDSVISRELGTVIVGKENTQTRERLVKPMAELLESGKPALVCMECSYGGHAVLVTSMAYDRNDPNTIFLTIYDSNVPGSNGSATLKRIKATKNGEFYDKYKFEYNGAGLLFTNIILERIELLNGEAVFYAQ